MDNLQPYSGSNLGDNFVAAELVTSFIARTKKDKSVFLRQDPTATPEFVDLPLSAYSGCGCLYCSAVFTLFFLGVYPWLRVFY
jgi:hypothetical protein